MQAFISAFLAVFQAIAAFITGLFGTSSTPITPISGKTTASQSIVMKIGAIDKIRQFEGACSDGEYVYQIMIEPSSSTGGDEKAVVLKIDPKTWTLAENGRSEMLTELNHANDITYDPRIKLLMISNNAPNYTLVSALYPDSLQYKAGMTIEHPLYSLAYVDTGSTSYYYAGISGTYNFGEYNGAFDTIKTFKGIDNGYVKQSIETDNQYLYCLFSDSNCIYKYDFSGNYLGRCFLPNPESGLNSYEAEGIFFHGGKMYVSYNILGKNNGGVICKIDKIEFKK